MRSGVHVIHIRGLNVYTLSGARYQNADWCWGRVAERPPSQSCYNSTCAMLLFGEGGRWRVEKGLVIRDDASSFK